jgi:hypothetical protein
MKKVVVRIGVITSSLAALVLAGGAGRFLR